MNRGLRILCVAMALVAGGSAGAQVQASLGQPLYPNLNRPLVIAAGDTVQMLIRFMYDGGPASRAAGKRLDFAYATRIPASDASGRQAQADRAAQILGEQAVELGVRRMSIGICDTRACAERKHPPAEWYLFERTSTGWKRSP